MMGAFNILPATIDFLPELVELDHACFSPPWTSKMWEAELLGNPFAHVVVAVSQENVGAEKRSVIGFHCFWVVFDELRLMRLAVRKSQRRQGIGRALAIAALEWGGQRGALRALLEVRRSNEAAQRLYRSLGFFSTGIRCGYYSNPSEDAVLMEMNPLALPVGIPPRQMEGEVAEG